GCGGNDVDVVRSVTRSDTADHAWYIAVAEHADVVLELDVEALAPELYQVWPVAGSDRRAGDTDGALARNHAHSHEIGVVVGGRALRLGHLDPTLLGHRGRVHLVDLLVHVSAEHTEEGIDREQAGIPLGDPAQELGLDPVDRGTRGKRGRDLAE